MGLTFPQMLEAAWDFWRPNRHGLRKYLLQDGKKHPFAVICPGGGYSMVCSFLEGTPYAKKLNEMGFHAFVVYYRVKKKARFPAPQEDLAWAIREILDHAERWNLDAENYSVWGSSAGGHLAASFGTAAIGYQNYQIHKPGALILAYPVITMGKETHTGARKNLLGKAPSDTLVNCTSVERQITSDYPKTFLWCGDADKTVSPKNSRALASQLAAHEIEHQFIEYPGVDHGVGLGNGIACEGWIEKAVRFWRKQTL